MFTDLSLNFNLFLIFIISQAYLRVQSLLIFNDFNLIIIHFYCLIIVMNLSDFIFVFIHFFIQVIHLATSLIYLYCLLFKGKAHYFKNLNFKIHLYIIDYPQNYPDQSTNIFGK